MWPAHLARDLRWLRQSTLSAINISHSDQLPNHRWYSAHYAHTHRQLPTADGQRPTWTSAYQLLSLTAIANNDSR